eukprot:UN11855
MLCIFALSLKAINNLFCSLSLAGNSVAALLRTFTQITGSFCLMLYLSPPLFGVMVGVIPIAA